MLLRGCQPPSLESNSSRDEAIKSTARASVFPLFGVTRVSITRARQLIIARAAIYLEIDRENKFSFFRQDTRNEKHCCKSNVIVNVFEYDSLRSFSKIFLFRENCFRKRKHDTKGYIYFPDYFFTYLLTYE